MGSLRLLRRSGGLIAGLLLLAAPGAEPARGDGLVLHSLAPCRVINTRNGAGASTSDDGPVGPLLNPGPHLFRLQGYCGIPNGAVAAELNFSVVEPSKFGDLRTFPADGPTPLVATMSYEGGIVALSNSVITPLGAVDDPTEADLKVLIGMTGGSGTGTIQLIIDVVGYFIPAGASFFGRFGGDGSDGALIVGNGETPTAPHKAQYTSLTIEEGGILRVNEGFGHAYIAVRGRCTIAGYIAAGAAGQPGGLYGAPSNGESGTNAVGRYFGFVVDAEAAEPIPFCFTGGGGAGGGVNGIHVGGHGGGGGVDGGVATNQFGTSGKHTPAPWFVGAGAANGSGTGTTLTDNFAALLQCFGPGGGSGAAELGGIDRGFGGRGGGIVYLECGELDFTGSITADGGAGSNPTGGVNSGGGGGGGGGVVLIRTKKVIANTGIVTVAGGAGAAGSGTGFGGGSGGAGYWDIVVIP